MGYFSGGIGISSSCACPGSTPGAPGSVIGASATVKHGVYWYVPPFPLSSVANSVACLTGTLSLSVAAPLYAEQPSPVDALELAGSDTGQKLRNGSIGDM